MEGIRLTKKGAVRCTRFRTDQRGIQILTGDWTDTMRFGCQLPQWAAIKGISREFRRRASHEPRVQFSYSKLTAKIPEIQCVAVLLGSGQVP